MTVFFPAAELIDRLVIAQIKHEKMSGENQKELDFYSNQAYTYELAHVAGLLAELKQVHLEIWALESDLRRGLEDNLGFEEIGKRAVAIRDWNSKRVKIKNKIATELGCDVQEYKKDHLSE
jgi:hypothetical protein